MHKFLLSFFALISFLVPTQAQDFNCRIKINDVQVQIADKSIFRQLEQRLTELMNNTKWSGEKVENNEKLEVNIEIILSGYDQASYEYRASAIIQSRRPVYGSTYSTTLFSFNDENFDFKFQDQDRLEFQDGNYLSDLSSLMGFYAYYMLGLDFDTFAPEGGTALFTKAFQVANLAQQSSSRAGWKPFERTVRTRYNLVDNILNERFRPLRQAYYLYHRKGLDQFQKDPLAARKQIMNSLAEVKKVFKIAPNTVMLLVFFEAKSDELVNIFKGAEEMEKPKAIELLSELNIANINKYEKIRG
ncbi:MAG: DUF4835 family protein [Bacteroidetes bacterium]|nr:DUF4835 family protein [Bacteroidota bacterium]